MPVSKFDLDRLCHVQPDLRTGRGQPTTSPEQFQDKHVQERRSAPALVGRNRRHVRASDATGPTDGNDLFLRHGLLLRRGVNKTAAQPGGINNTARGHSAPGRACSQDLSSAHGSLLGEPRVEVGAVLLRDDVAPVPLDVGRDLQQAHTSFCAEPAATHQRRSQQNWLQPKHSQLPHTVRDCTPWHSRAPSLGPFSAPAMLLPGCGGRDEAAAAHGSSPLPFQHPLPLLCHGFYLLLHGGVVQLWHGFCLLEREAWRAPAALRCGLRRCCRHGSLRDRAAL